MSNFDIIFDKAKDGEMLTCRYKYETFHFSKIDGGLISRNLNVPPIKILQGTWSIRKEPTRTEIRGCYEGGDASIICGNGIIDDNPSYSYDFKQYISRGRSYKTRAEAKIESKREVEYISLLREIEVLNDGWRPDFSNLEQIKWCICGYDFSQNRVEKWVNHSIQIRPVEEYLETQKKLLQLIERHGDQKLAWLLLKIDFENKNKIV